MEFPQFLCFVLCLQCLTLVFNCYYYHLYMTFNVMFSNFSAVMPDAPVLFQLVSLLLMQMMSLVDSCAFKLCVANKLCWFFMVQLQCPLHIMHTWLLSEPGSTWSLRLQTVGPWQVALLQVAEWVLVPALDAVHVHLVPVLLWGPSLPSRTMSRGSCSTAKDVWGMLFMFQVMWCALLCSVLLGLVWKKRISRHCEVCALLILVSLKHLLLWWIQTSCVEIWAEWYNLLTFITVSCHVDCGDL